MKNCCSQPILYIQKKANELICQQCKTKHQMANSRDWIDAFKYDIGLQSDISMFNHIIVQLPLEIQLMIKLT